MLQRRDSSSNVGTIICEESWLTGGGARDGDNETCWPFNAYILLSNTYTKSQAPLSTTVLLFIAGAGGEIDSLEPNGGADEDSQGRKVIKSTLVKTSVHPPLHMYIVHPSPVFVKRIFCSWGQVCPKFCLRGPKTTPSSQNIHTCKYLFGFQVPYFGIRNPDLLLRDLVPCLWDIDRDLQDPNSSLCDPSSGLRHLQPPASHQPPASWKPF